MLKYLTPLLFPIAASCSAYYAEDLSETSPLINHEGTLDSGAKKQQSHARGDRQALIQEIATLNNQDPFALSSMVRASLDDLEENTERAASNNYDAFRAAYHQYLDSNKNIRFFAAWRRDATYYELARTHISNSARKDNYVPARLILLIDALHKSSAPDYYNGAVRKQAQQLEELIADHPTLAHLGWIAHAKHAEIYDALYDCQGRTLDFEKGLYSHIMSTKLSGRPGKRRETSCARIYDYFVPVEGVAPVPRSDDSAGVDFSEELKDSELFTKVARQINNPYFFMSALSPKTDAIKMLSQCALVIALEGDRVSLGPRAVEAARDYAVLEQKYTNDAGSQEQSALQMLKSAIAEKEAYRNGVFKAQHLPLWEKRALDRYIAQEISDCY